MNIEADDLILVQLFCHSSSDPHTTLSFQLRSTYYSLIPAPIYILLSHCSSDLHITLSFHLWSRYYSTGESTIWSGHGSCSEFDGKLWGL